MPPNLLRRIHIIGSGGREYATFARLLGENPNLQVTSAPGSSSWSPMRVGVCPSVSVSDRADWGGQLQLAKIADLTFVGPELPLVDGLADYLRKEAGCTVFGPSAAAAQIEGSKAFSSRFLQKYNIPIPWFKVFDSSEKCQGWLSENDAKTVVLKVNGLAAGKGVFLPQSATEAADIVRRLMVDQVLGEAGKTVVIQEKIAGPEFSVMVITDGKTIQCCPAVQDYKRIFAGDMGPNTGGMGSVGSIPVDMDRVTQIAQTIVDGMKEEGYPFVGCLFIGFMDTADGLKILEINCRFGDPETITLMALLTPESNLGETLYAAALGDLASVPKLVWGSDKAVTVVMASAGYPTTSTKGNLISGIEQAVENGAIVTYMGTEYNPDSGWYKTNGGRVLAVTGLGSTIAQAAKLAYEGVSLISFEGMQYRKDIGKGITY